MGINIDLAKRAEKIAKEISKVNGMPVELNLTEAYNKILMEDTVPKKRKGVKK